MLFSPQVISAKGSTVLTMPTMNRSRMLCQSLGTRFPRRYATRVSPTAAIPVRTNTTWKVDSCSTPIRIKRNEDPQTKVRIKKPIHARCLVIIRPSECRGGIRLTRRRGRLIAAGNETGRDR